MGKKKGAESSSGQHTRMSIREEVSGKKQTNSLKSIMKLQQLQNLTVWASGEASIPSLAALFGRRFAATGEALGLPPDPSLLPCQRCETILQPGFNCTVRVVRIRAKTRGQGKKAVSDQQNNVVYKCQLCSCENVKRGTPKGHMKEICPPKPKQPSKPKPAQSSVAGDPSTPSAMKGLTLLDSSKKRKRNKPKPKKPDELEAQKAEVASTKRRRKGWTTLREIAENNERERTKTFTNFSIPFTL